MASRFVYIDTNELVGGTPEFWVVSNIKNAERSGSDVAQYWKEVRRLMREEGYDPDSAQDLAHEALHGEKQDGPVVSEKAKPAVKEPESAEGSAESPEEDESGSPEDDSEKVSNESVLEETVEQTSVATEKAVEPKPKTPVKVEVDTKKVAEKASAKRATKKGSTKKGNSRKTDKQAEDVSSEGAVETDEVVVGEAIKSTKPQAPLKVLKKIPTPVVTEMTRIVTSVAPASGIGVDRQFTPSNCLVSIIAAYTNNLDLCTTFEEKKVAEALLSSEQGTMYRHVREMSRIMQMLNELKTLIYESTVVGEYSIRRMLGFDMNESPAKEKDLTIVGTKGFDEFHEAVHREALELRNLADRHNGVPYNVK